MIGFHARRVLSSEQVRKLGAALEPRNAVAMDGVLKRMAGSVRLAPLTHALVFDEAHRAAQLELIPTMAKECRKCGISLVLASWEADISIFSFFRYWQLSCSLLDGYGYEIPCQRCFKLEGRV